MGGWFGARVRYYAAVVTTAAATISDLGLHASDALFQLHGDSLPEDVVVASYKVTQSLSTPYAIRVEFSTADDNFRASDCLRTRLVLQVTEQGGEDCFFDGVCSQAAFVRVVGERLHFFVTMRPSLWSLSLRQDCRIFQESSHPDIIKTLLEEAGLSDKTEWHLSISHTPRDYVVQYKESSLNFIHRLCEDSGIYYYFTHDEEGHILHFADNLDPLDELGEEVPVALGQGGAVGTTPLLSFRRTQRLRTSSVTLRDFNVDNPAIFPEAAIPAEQPVPQPFYGYPGKFVDAEEGEKAAASTIKSQRTDADTARGTLLKPKLMPGHRIAIEGASREEINQTFRLVKCTTTGTQHSASGQPPQAGLVSFDAVPTSADYLPPKKAHRPRITGIQTAVVVGDDNADQAIYVDHLGRIKVHFHWDRMQPFDDEASCWIRVAQPALGGSMILPRVGWEVSVAFLEGDPDRPIVLGRAYNAENMPPMALPASKASGSFSSKSSPGGAGENGITLGDTGGSQGFSVKAQKDLNATTGYDQSESVGVDDEVHINENFSRSVGVDDETAVSGNQSLTVGAHATQKIGGSQSVSVSGNENANATANYLEKVASDRSFSVTGNQMMLCNGERTSVAGNVSRTVGAAEINASASNLSHNIMGSSSSNVGAVRVHLTGGSHGEVVAGAKSSTIAAGEAHVTNGDFSSESQGAVAHLVGGVAQRKVDGDLTIKAPTVSLVGGTGKLKGGSSEIALSGGPIKMKGSIIAIKAAVVKMTSGALKLG